MEKNTIITLLHDCHYGNVNGVKKVFEENELSVNSPDNNHKLVMKTITGQGSLEEKKSIIEYLCDKGVDINYPNGFAVTCLINRQDLPLLSFLVDKLKADLHINDIDNMTDAVSTNNKDLVLYLLNHNIEPDTNFIIENKDIFEDINREILELLGIENYDTSS